MSGDLQDLVQRQHLDFIGEHWVLVEPKRQPDPATLAYRAKIEGLQGLLAEAENSARLTDWELNFCDDMRKRLDEWGIHTEISPKQWDVLNRVEEKLYR